MGRPMRIELTRVGLLVYLANHYTTRGARMATSRDLSRKMNTRKGNLKRYTGFLLIAAQFFFVRTNNDKA